MAIPQRPDHGLSERQLAILRQVLAPYADRIARVGLFGSRAAGVRRPTSDIDLAIVGSVTQAEIDRLWTLFDDSSLDVTVDVVALHLVDDAGLKARITAEFHPLFEHGDLRTAAL